MPTWNELPNGSWSAYAGILPLLVERRLEIGGWVARVNGVLLIGSCSPVIQEAQAAAMARAEMLAQEILRDLGSDADAGGD